MSRGRFGYGVARCPECGTTLDLVRVLGERVLPGHRFARSECIASGWIVEESDMVRRAPWSDDETAAALLALVQRIKAEAGR